MDRKEQEFLKRLRETFRFEAEDHLRSLSTHFIELEKTGDAPHACGDGRDFIPRGAQPQGCGAFRKLEGSRNHSASRSRARLLR